MRNSRSFIETEKSLKRLLGLSNLTNNLRQDRSEFPIELEAIDVGFFIHGFFLWFLRVTFLTSARGSATAFC